MAENRKARPLTAARVRTEKRPGRYYDGQGLYLQVDPSGARRWLQRIVIRGKRTDLGLGGWPLVSLNAAREKAMENRRIARVGGDPRTEKRDVPTFAEAAAEVIKLNRPTWKNVKHAAQWSSTLRTYAFPHFGSRLVTEVSGSDVMKALTLIWTAKPETARRVRQRVSAVMKWAIANNYRLDNPAGDAIEAVLPRTSRTQVHHKALHYAAVPAALRAVQASRGTDSSRLSLEFQVLTACRPGEARNAQWSEIDIGTRTWTIPSERMKADREHRVPLPERGMEILAEARSLDDGSGLVFPSRSGRPLSDMTNRKLLMTLGIDCVPHGFRSSFRDWAAEMTDAPHVVMEAALAHVVGNSTEAAYFRSDLFERRLELMIQWADYLGERAARCVK